MLEPGRKGPFKPPTEPDIMLIIPKKFIILIEANEPLSDKDMQQLAVLLK